jgi:hypothetical protein
MPANNRQGSATPDRPQAIRRPITLRYGPSVRLTDLPGAGRLPECMHAVQLWWPQAGPVPVSYGLAPAPARRAKTSPMAGSRLNGGSACVLPGID